MKFKIRYADQIVGFFSLVALIGIIVLIFSIGSKQHWFVKKNYYYSIFDSSTGFSVGMDLTYKGFSIGKVKSVSLQGWMVRVDFYVTSEYEEYVKENSLVELISSPIGLGSSFVLHPGLGPDLMPTNSEIYRKNSGFGEKIIAEKKIRIEQQADSISVLMIKASDLLDNLNLLLKNVNYALEGKGNSTITGIFKNIEKITATLNKPEGAVPALLGSDITDNLVAVISDVDAILSDSDGVVPSLLGPQFSTDLSTILSDVSSVLEQVNNIAENADNLIDVAVPEIEKALADLDIALKQLNDLLVGVSNLPVIRSRVPDRSNEAAASVHLRNPEF